MQDRITNETVGHALKRYESALLAVGLSEAETAGITLAAPYGQMLHVVRYDRAAHAYHHDLPGFTGSWHGFTTRRKAVEALDAATNTLRDLAYCKNVKLA
jgi:hypothetical protein